MENLGYDSFFDSAVKELNSDLFAFRVTEENRDSYRVKNDKGEYLARIKGKDRFIASSREDLPAVGDWVLATLTDKESVIIEKILPRKTLLKRKGIGREKVQVIAANVDIAFIVESTDRDYNLNRFERYISIAKDGGIKPTIILNKTDLLSKEELDVKTEQIKNRFPEIDFIKTSVSTERGIDDLRLYMEKGKTYCFVGSSGVGKSSLINKLLDKEIIKTNEVGARTGKGKHTTTRREMYFLNNGSIVIDNPGMREVGMTDTKTGIKDTFEEIYELAGGCRFSDCTHQKEPGCKVLEALKEGKIGQEKYFNYINLKKEANFYEMTEIEKRDKDKKFGKFLKTSKKQLKIED
jgi:ribosome biogenesis GTPase